MSKNRSAVFTAESPIVERKLTIQEAQTFRFPIPYKRSDGDYILKWHTFAVPPISAPGEMIEDGKPVQVVLDSWRRAMEQAEFEIKQKLGFK